MLLKWRFCQAQSHVTQKLWQIWKIWPDQIEILCPSLRISGQLPATIVNSGGDSFWKWKDFQLWRACEIDLRSGHTAYRRASLINLYLHAKFHWNWRNFLWTDGCMDRCTHGRTDGRTDGLRDGRTFTHFIRSTQKSRPKDVLLQLHITTDTTNAWCD